MITFIILCYNQEDTIKSAIESVILSGITHEIIVLDNGSTDNSISIIEKMDCKLIKVNAFKNKSKARNIGIKMAKENYIRFLDGDDYFDEINLKKEIEYMIENNIKDDLIFTKHLTIYNGLMFHKNYEVNSFGGIANYYVKKDFLIQNKIFFDEEKFFYFFDDSFFYSHLFLNAKTINKDLLNDNFFHSYVCIKKEKTSSDLMVLSTEEIIEYGSLIEDFVNYLKKNFCNKNDVITKEIKSICEKYITYYYGELKRRFYD